jgi:hypothetical protein
VGHDCGVTTPVGEYVDRLFNPDGLNGTPWMEGRQPIDEFRRQIVEALDKNGTWHTRGEFAMGGDINVRLDKVEGESGSVVYRATADCGITISGDYSSIDRALGMLSVSAHLCWDMVSKSEAGRDLQF